MVRNVQGSQVGRTSPSVEEVATLLQRDVFLTVRLAWPGEDHGRDSVLVVGHCIRDVLASVHGGGGTLSDKPGAKADKYSERFYCVHNS